MLIIIWCVLKDVVLFNDTVAYNLKYGDLDSSHEDIVKFAKQAQIHDTIQRMPRGYNTLVGERLLS